MRCGTAVLFMLLIISAAGCKEKLPVEKEPNDSFSGANPIEVGKTMTGFINTIDDVDYYRLEVLSPAVYDIVLEGIKGVNHAFRIWKNAERPELIKWVDDNRKSSPERMANFSVTPGTWFIAVSHGEKDQKKANTETPYLLTVRVQETRNGESEPNDEPATATPIAADETLSGYFSPAYNRLNTLEGAGLHREEDWYVIAIEASSEKPMEFSAVVSGVTGVNALLGVYDAQRQELAMIDNGGTGEGESLSGLGITGAGNYYLMVASKNYTANVAEPYTLQAFVREHDATREMESNGDFTSANALQEHIDGTFNFNNDADYFSFLPPAAGGVYRVALESPPDANAFMTLYDAEQKKIIDVDTGGKGGVDLYPNFSAKNRLYVVVAPRVAITPPVGDYRLSITPLPEHAGIETEPNDQKVLAGKIKGTSISGYVSRPGDIDYFLYEGKTRVKLTLAITGIMGGTIRVSVTDPLGYVIRSVMVKDKISATLSEMIDKKGYILVESLVDNFDHPYTIQLRGVR